MSLWLELLSLAAMATAMGYLAHRVFDENRPSAKDRLRDRDRAVDLAVEELSIEPHSKGGPSC